MTDPNTTALTSGIHEVVINNLAPFGADAAIVTRESDSDRVLFRIAPSNPRAAAVAIAVKEDNQVLLSFGRTSTKVVGPVQHVLDQLDATLRAVFMAHFVETGPGDGHSELRLSTGQRIRLGSEKSPLSRRFGPKHHYEPYA